MGIYSIHGGHNGFVQGANYGGRKEHLMDRQVKDAVVNKLRALGHTVYDDTDESGTSQSANLNNIVAKCNSHYVDLIVSIHLNAFNTTAHGVEVCYYDQEALASKVSAQLAKDIGWFDRGPKKRTDLAVLANTKAPAILIELGFIDNEADMLKWHVDRIANSIVYAITGQTVGGGGTTQPSKQNIVQTGAFGRNEMPDVAGALTSLNMTGNFILQGDGMVYVVTDGTSDAQRKAFTDYLDKKTWWYEVK